MSVVFNGKEYEIKKEKLDLSNNQIVHIGDIEGLVEVKRLNSLNLSNNKITDLAGLEHFSNLKVLNLAYNNIRNIHELGRLESLEYLNLSNNSITSLTGISKLTKLKTLNLSNNQISNVEELKSLINLEKIYLQGNNIEQSSRTRLQDSLGVEIERSIVKIRERAPLGSSINIRTARRTAVIIMLILPFIYSLIFINAIATSISLSYVQALTLVFLPVLGYTLLIYFGIMGLFLIVYGIASALDEDLTGVIITFIMLEIIFPILGYIVYSIFAPTFFGYQA